MSDEIRVVAVLQAKSGQESAVRDALLACVTPSRLEAGCRFYTAHQDADKAGKFVVIERWESREALKEHGQTPHFQALVTQTAPLLAEPLQAMVLTEV